MTPVPAPFRKAAFLAAALALPGLAAAVPVKIGVINSMTGPEAPIGENLTNGIKLAEEDLKAKGVDLQIVWEDDTGKPQIAMSAMEKLATRDGVAGLVGPYTSADANAVAKLAQKYKVPQIIPAAAKEDITRQGFQWVFRLNAPASVYASALIDAASALGKPQSVALIYENTDFGTSVSAAAKEYTARKGMKVVFDESYSKGSPDYRSSLTKMKAANPDLVFMVSYVADAILLMRQAREIGLKPQAFLGGGAGFDTAQFEGEKEISNLVFSVTQWTPDTGWPGAKGFAQRYETRFGKKPAYHAACAYEAMMIMGEVASKAGGDRVKAREGLALGSWDGIMGKVKFETYDGFTNQNKHVMPVIQYLGGKSETVFPPDIRTKPPVYPFPGWK